MVGKVNALRVPPQPLAEEVEAAAVAARVVAGDSLSSSVIQHDKSCKNCYQLFYQTAANNVAVFLSLIYD